MKQTLANRIRQLRGDRTQAEMAKKCGIKQQMWARYESGITTPGAEALIAICIACGESADWLLGISPAEDRNRLAKAEEELAGLRKAAAAFEAAARPYMARQAVSGELI